MKDPYQTLGVNKSADQADIKRAYRKLAKELHPDVNKGNDKVEARFKDVSAAYSIIGDEKTRQRFDRGEIDANGNERGPQFHPGGGFHSGSTGARGNFRAEDIFGDFSSIFGNMRSGGQRRPAKGEDRSYRISVSFMDAAKGGTRRITLPAGKNLDVRIPAGIEEGKQIRLKGQGDPGPGRAPAGDALIEVTIEAHPYFKRDGLDIHLELPISLNEAINGGKVQVPTIEGSVNLAIPKNASTGKRMRLKGKGIAKAGGKVIGDQYVELKVALPEQADPELEKVISDWSQKNDYNPRKKAGIE